ncbi:MAG: serine hydroxymethyltransferase [Planctomycetes bacterium]|nr:serine hydroxymethyltransferase [Planctomycetota bacterium]
MEGIEMQADGHNGNNALDTLKKSDIKVYELIGRQSQGIQTFEQYHKGILDALRTEDGIVYDLIAAEHTRVQDTIQLIAAENQCSQAVLAALGSVAQNKTTEGFPGARFHGGSEVVDEIETLAAARAKEVFGARYANVQPHSGSTANQIVLAALLNSGDKILSMGFDQGGHPSHGAAESLIGKLFEVESYYVDRDSFLLDYEAIRQQALNFRPKLIICGATAYSRTIDFAEFRSIADEVGAFLLADISHISGLVIAGAHPSPMNYAHFTTTSTYKPGGPRGGLILMGEDTALCKRIEQATFPGVQGTPYLNHIAAKAVFFKEALSEEYKARQFEIVENARRLAYNLVGLGYDVLTGGTDNHMVLVNVANFKKGLTGIIAQKCLEDCGIVINMNKLPYDKRCATVTSGMRLGTPIVTKNSMGVEQMDEITSLVDAVLKEVQVVSETEYELDESFCDEIRGRVKKLCSRFPMR